MSSVTSQSHQLLDRRYRIMTALPGYPPERHFAAWHVELDIPVRIISVRQSGRQAAERMWARAVAAVTLRHPGIVRVRDIFRQGATFTLVLDWTPRETLAARLAASGPLPLHEALALGLRLCDTLGVIARHAPLLLPLGTLAPETLAQSSDGHYLLTDLGIRNWSAGWTPQRSHDGARSIASGSPEVTEPGRYSDLFSVGAILYAALTGVSLGAPGSNRPSLAALAPGVPALVCETIERALQPRPEDRYATPEAYGAALGVAIQHALPGVIAPAHPKRPLGFPDRPSHMSRERTARHPRQPHAADERAIPPQLHRPGAWAHERTRGEAPRPLRRTGERALEAISTALRLGA